MILIRRERLEMWLSATGKDFSWLAKRFGVTKGFVSQVVNNRCKISTAMIERLLGVTQIDFERLFFFDGKRDTREFLDSCFCVDGDPHDMEEYKEIIKQKIK